MDIVGEMLNLIKKTIILVTSDGDRPVPSSYDSNLINKILSSSKIKKWYTQNYDKSITHPKLDYYPIGLDMHCQRTLICRFMDKFIPQSKLRRRKLDYYIKCNRKNKNNKFNKIFCDAHLNYSHSERKDMYETLKMNTIIDFQNKYIKYKNIVNKYSQYKFILSPRGNGLDCHRTWEIFLLGSVVITKSCSLDEMYIKNELPVIIVNNYNDINKISDDQFS